MVGYNGKAGGDLPAFPVPASLPARRGEPLPGVCPVADPVSVTPMDKIVSLAKRRGFIFQSSEIYGGQGGAWDYGPLGVELKNNIKRAWWRSNVLERPDMVGLDAAILMHPRTWEASGHVGHFTDPMVDCRACKHRFRADHVGTTVELGRVRLEFGLATSLLRSDDNQAFLIVGPFLVADAPRITLGNAGLEVRGSLRGALPSSQIPNFVKSGADWVFVEPGATIEGGESAWVAFDVAGIDLTNALITLDFGGQHRAYLRIPKPNGPVEFATCPDCGGELTQARMFNLMFKTFVGPVEESAAQVYLRPETAQGMFVNFANVVTSMRRKLPFGIAQIGKAFRNEITPGNFTFRSREFEQMEIEFFVKPGTDDEWHQRWIAGRLAWYSSLGMDASRLRLRPHDPDELAHYAKGTSDIEYLFPMGWSELEGIANRTDFDLRQHSEFSGEKLTYFDDETGEHITPYVIEPSAGADRATLAFLLDAYREEEVAAGPGKTETRVVLGFHPTLAPVKVAVLPLSRNEKLTPTAQEVYASLRTRLRDQLVQYDDSQSIGRRYRRQDEIGTPFCVTVDFETVENDHAVTIRERDSMAQERVAIADLVPALREKLGIG